MYINLQQARSRHSNSQNGKKIKEKKKEKIYSLNTSNRKVQPFKITKEGQISLVDTVSNHIFTIPMANLPKMATLTRWNVHWRGTASFLGGLGSSGANSPYHHNPERALPRDAARPRSTAREQRNG